MSRAMQLEDDHSPSTTLRQQLMAMERHELVALVEEATAREIDVTADNARLMQRVAHSEDVGKRIIARSQVMLQKQEAEIWERATGGTRMTLSLLTAMLRNTVATLIARDGRERVILAKIMIDIIVPALLATELPDVNNPTDIAHTIATQFFVICQIANHVPATGMPRSWYQLGSTLYKP